MHAICRHREKPSSRRLTHEHMHHEWPLYPIPEHEGHPRSMVDEKALLEMELLLQEGIRPDGFSTEERESTIFQEGL